MRLAGLVLLTVTPLASAILSLPHGDRNRVISPDGHWALYGVPYQEGANQGPELWIENLRTHRAQKLLDVADTLRAAWFPDSAQFWVEDHSASDRTQAYIYEPLTLRRLDIRSAVLSADPSIALLDKGHRYYNVENAGTRALFINFRGHTDQAPVQCFDTRYRVTRAGAVRRLQQRVWPIAGSPGSCR